MRYFADGKTACAALGRLSVVALAALLMAGCTSGEEAQNEGTEENDGFGTPAPLPFPLGFVI